MEEQINNLHAFINAATTRGGFNLKEIKSADAALIKLVNSIKQLQDELNAKKDETPSVSEGE